MGISAPPIQRARRNPALSHGPDSTPPSPLDRDSIESRRQTEAQCFDGWRQDGEASYQIPGRESSRRRSSRESRGIYGEGTLGSLSRQGRMNVRRTISKTRAEITYSCWVCAIASGPALPCRSSWPWLPRRAPIPKRPSRCHRHSRVACAKRSAVISGTGGSARAPEASGAGIGAVLCVLVLLSRVLLARDHSLDPRDNSLVGVVARVTAQIGPHRTGEIRCVVCGARQARPARSFGSEAFERGERPLALGPASREHGDEEESRERQCVRGAGA